MSEVGDRLADLQLVSIECMPPFTIINKSFTATGPGIFVRGYNFCNARERVCDRRNNVTQIYQQITVPGGC